MDNEQRAIPLLDGDDLQRPFHLVVAEEVEPRPSPSTRPAWEADTSVLYREKGLGARNAVSRRRSRPTDPFAVDPVILSDDTSATRMMPEGISQKSPWVDLFVRRASDENVAPTLRIEVEVLPGPNMLVGLDYGAVLEEVPKHPHEVGELVGRDVDEGPPIGSEAVGFFSMKPVLGSSCHAHDPADEMRAGQDVSGPIWCRLCCERLTGCGYSRSFIRGMPGLGFLAS
jgi:hypothetical protein